MIDWYNKCMNDYVFKRWANNKSHKWKGGKEKNELITLLEKRLAQIIELRSIMDELKIIQSVENKKIKFWGIFGFFHRQNSFYISKDNLSEWEYLLKQFSKQMTKLVDPIAISYL